MAYASYQEDNTRFKTREEIANEYGISTKTLRRKLNKAGVAFSKGLLSIKEQNIIYDLFGKPNYLDYQ